MDRIWRWAWDRYGARYSWVVYAITFTALVPVYLLLSFLVLAFERSDRYVEGGAVTVVAVLVLFYVTVLPGLDGMHLADRWAAGQQIDRATALEATYTWGRRAVARNVTGVVVCGGLQWIIVGMIAGATPARLVQYGVLGAVLGVAIQLIGVHSFLGAAVRPARDAIAGDTGVGDALPRSRPTFAAWSNVSILAVAFAFAVGGALVAGVFDRVSELPVLAVVIGLAYTVGFAVPITVGAAYAPSLLPIRDLAEGTERVAGGDYSQRLPVVQDDDLGALAASFNRMQAGLAERQRLQAAFGTYVDPALAARLL